MSDFGVSDPNRPVFWWKEGKDANRHVFSTVAALRRKYNSHWDSIGVHYRLYGLMDNYNISNWGSMASDFNGYMSKIRLNVIKMVCDTAQARIAKSRPRPQFLTQKGNYSKKAQGQKLGMFVEGVYYENETHQKAQDSFLFSAITGGAAIKILDNRQDKNVKLSHEVVFPHELVYDPEEAKNGNCYTLYQIKMLNKYDLAEIYDNKKIASASPSATEFSDVFGYNDNIFAVPVIEAWRVPLGKSKGRHIICTDNVVILDEEWKDLMVPFEFLPYGVSLMGKWSQGVASNTKGMQLEINKVLKDIQTIIHLGCTPKIFLDENTKIISSHLNNEIGTVIKLSGGLGGFKQDQLLRVPTELWQQVEFLYNKAHDINGLTLSSSTGMKPPGLDSGKALREYNDIEQERFSIIAQNYENFHVRLWKHTIVRAKSIGLEHKKYSVLSFDKYGTQKIDWKEIDLNTDEYILQCHAVGFLSKHPSGKIEDVQKLMDMGVISPEQGLGLLEFPDTEGFYNEVNAIRKSFEKIVEGIVDKGTYMPPSPLYGEQFLAAGIEFMRSSFFMYQNEGMDDEKLELFTRWINDAMGIIGDMAATAAGEVQGQTMEITEEQADQDIENEAMRTDPAMQEQLAIEMQQTQQPITEEI